MTSAVAGYADEHEALLAAAQRAGLDPSGAELVARSSRAMWHLPAADAAVAVTKPHACVRETVVNEAQAIRAAIAAGVRTPRLLTDAIDLEDERFALTFDWVTGSGMSADSWPALAAEAALLPTAATAGIQPLHLDPAVPAEQWTGILGHEPGEAFADHWRTAAAEVEDLASTGPVVLTHGDLQPANVLVDPAGDPWLLAFECARVAPAEWDPAKVMILADRFEDPSDAEPLLTAWPPLDPDRLTRCVRAQEVLTVGWLVQMAARGTPGAARVD